MCKTPQYFNIASACVCMYLCKCIAECCFAGRKCEHARLHVFRRQYDCNKQNICCTNFDSVNKYWKFNKHLTSWERVVYFYLHFFWLLLLKAVRYRFVFTIFRIVVVVVGCISKDISILRMYILRGYEVCHWFGRLNFYINNLQKANFKFFHRWKFDKLRIFK